MTEGRTLSDADIEALADAIARRSRRPRKPAPVEPAAVVLDELGALRIAKARDAAEKEIRRRGQGRRLK